LIEANCPVGGEIIQARTPNPAIIYGILIYLGVGNGNLAQAAGLWYFRLGDIQPNLHFLDISGMDIAIPNPVPYRVVRWARRGC
jgi:hypothetical protein